MKAPYRFVSQGSKFAQLKQGVPTGKTYSSFEAARTETLRLNDAWRAGQGKRSNPKPDGRPTDAEIREFAAVLFRNSPLDPYRFSGSSRRLLDQWFDALYAPPWWSSSARNSSAWVKEFIPEYEEEDLNKLAKVLHEYQNDPGEVPMTSRILYPKSKEEQQIEDDLRRLGGYNNNPSLRRNYRRTNWLYGLSAADVRRGINKGELAVTHADIGDGYYTVTLFDDGVGGENRKRVEAKWFVRGEDAWYTLSNDLTNGKVDPSTADLFLGPSRWDKRERETETREAAARKGIHIAEKYHYFNNPKARRSR